jgi:hypothetical protein
LLYTAAADSADFTADPPNFAIAGFFSAERSHSAFSASAIAATVRSTAVAAAAIIFIYCFDSAFLR